MTLIKTLIVLHSNFKNKDKIMTQCSPKAGAIMRQLLVLELFVYRYL